MPDNILKKYGVWITAFAGFLLVAVFYGKFIFNPGAYMFSGGGDGVKNYYTVAWHAQYDSSYTHFGGMNYPYGEHTVFTDNQPLVSNTMQWVHKHIFPIGNHTIAIVNLLMFLGLVLAFVYLYKLFFAFTQNGLFAMLAALSIGLLSPQVIRITEHFALAYCFVIPFFIWLFYKFFKAPAWGRSFGIALALLLLLYIHLYYIVIIGGMAGALWLVLLIHRQTGMGFIKSLAHLALQVVLPLAAYFVWLKLTDTVTDRPTEPFGLSEFAAHWEGLLLPMGFGYFEPVAKALHIRTISNESFAYAGLPVLLFVIAGLVRGIVSLFRKKQNKQAEKAPVTFERVFITALLIASGLLFVYAAFVPALLKIEAVGNYLSLLKQFRSLGRLLWVAFYALNIFAFVYLFQRYKNSPRYKFIPWLLPALVFADAALLNVRVAKGLDIPKPTLAWVPAHINAQNYRAIIPLPYFHEGSESINIYPKNNAIVQQCLLLSWQTGVPLHAVKMSRTSISQTLAQAEMGFEFTLVPEILSSDTTRPYLLYAGEGYEEYLPEIYTLQPVAAHGKTKLYAVTKNTFKTILDNRAKKILNEEVTIKREVTEVIYRDYDTDASPKIFKGKGALQVHVGDTVSLYKGDCLFCNDSVTLTVWLYANMQGIAQPKILINTGAKHIRVQPLDNIKAISRQWALIEYKFLPQPGPLDIRLMKETKVQKEPLYADEFLLRAHNFALQKDSFVMMNGRFYHRPGY